MRDHEKETARQICDAVLDHAVPRDEYLREINERESHRRQNGFHHQAPMAIDSGRPGH